MESKETPRSRNYCVRMTEVLLCLSVFKLSTGLPNIEAFLSYGGNREGSHQLTKYSDSHAGYLLYQE